MCLAVPGKITQIIEEGALRRTGRVDFSGIIKHANLAYVPDAKVGDYVIVHVGFAISKLDEAEAKRVFEYLAEMGDLEELKSLRTSSPADSGGGSILMDSPPATGGNDGL